MTGQLGEVMQESAKIAQSYIWAHAADLGVDPDTIKNNGVHVHVPAGAIPKDGPSAGITMAIALVSALSGRQVRRDVAMTVEISLRGRVLPIGGLKQKVLASHRAGITTVLFPEKNTKDLEDIPPEVREAVELIPVQHMDEVVALALLDRPATAEATKYAHFDAMLLPGLDATWHTPPPAPAG